MFGIADTILTKVVPHGSYFECSPCCLWLSRCLLLYFVFTDAVTVVLYHLFESLAQFDEITYAEVLFEWDIHDSWWSSLASIIIVCTSFHERGTIKGVVWNEIGVYKFFVICCRKIAEAVIREWYACYDAWNHKSVNVMRYRSCSVIRLFIREPNEDFHESENVVWKCDYAFL